MIDNHYDITCVSCGQHNDGDPISVLSAIGKVPAGIHDPVKMNELTYFWLCRDCREDYPNGAKDYFIESYFTEDELYLCQYCKAFIPESVRDEFDDTKTCLTCSPRDPDDE